MPERAGKGPSADRMIETAERSTNGESYQSIMRGVNFRVGVIVTMRPNPSPSVLIELLLRIFESFSPVDPPSLEKALGVLRQLIKRGYQVAHEDDGWFCCRKSMISMELTTECRLLHELLDEYYGDIGG